MLNISQIDLLLGIGITVAIVAISGGIRGVYSVSASARRERTNQTTTMVVLGASRKRKAALENGKKRRRAA